MNDSIIGVLAGTLTSLAIKGVDLTLTREKGRKDETVQERDRLSADIWNLLNELRQDYDRLDTELKSERLARQHAEEQARDVGARIAELQDQVTRQETKTEKYKGLAEERLTRISTLAKEMAGLQARVDELEMRDRASHLKTAPAADTADNAPQPGHD